LTSAARVVKGQPFRKRLGFAVQGVAEAWRREASFRTQFVLGIVAVIVIAALRPGWMWAAIVAIAIALVLALEMVNAALEAVIDHLHPDAADPIRRAKDMAAGAVLAASAGAAIVGVLMVASVTAGW
jgi:diacylglycerol kinase (ATP)